MSWATATCTCERCGNVFYTRKECYNSREAADWEEWAPDHITVCRECKAKAEQQKRDEAAALAKEIAEAAGYPQLTGSEKQIAWAMRIREKKADALEDIRARAQREKCPERKEIAAERIAAIDRIMAHSESRWWIDVREESPEMLIKNTISAMRREKK